MGSYHPASWLHLFSGNCQFISTHPKSEDLPNLRRITHNSRELAIVIFCGIRELSLDAQTT
jgi:hypothetical protein